MKRLHQRRNRLHDGANDNVLAIRHAALKAARAVRPAHDGIVLAQEHLIVCLTARERRIAEACADLDALDGLDRHHGSGKPRVETPIPLDVAAESERRARDAHLEDAAERIARLFRRTNLLFHALFSLSIKAVEFRSRLMHRARLALDCIGGDAADVEHGGLDRDAECEEKLLRHSADGDAHRRLSRARPLQDVAYVLTRVLPNAREVCVSGARRRHLLAVRLAERRHALLPVLPIAVLDRERNRSAERLTEAHARENSHRICFDFHASAAPVALLATRQITVDVFQFQRKPRRNTLQDGCQRRAVRFARR